MEVRKSVPVKKITKNKRAQIIDAIDDLAVGNLEKMVGEAKEFQECTLLKLEKLLHSLEFNQINEPKDLFDQVTFIEHAVITLKIDAVQLLVRYGANVDSVNSATGRTPLLELITQPGLSSRMDDCLRMLEKLKELEAKFCCG